MSEFLFLEKLAERLKKYKAEDVASATGLSFATVQKARSGRLRAPGFVTLNKLVNYLNQQEASTKQADPEHQQQGDDHGMA